MNERGIACEIAAAALSNYICIAVIAIVVNHLTFNARTNEQGCDHVTTSISFTYSCNSSIYHIRVDNSIFYAVNREMYSNYTPEYEHQRTRMFHPHVSRMQVSFFFFFASKPKCVIKSAQRTAVKSKTVIMCAMNTRRPIN